MSEEMAVTDNATGEDAKLNSEETATGSAVEAEVTPAEGPTEPGDPPANEESATVPEEDALIEKLEMSDDKIEDKEEEPTKEKPPEKEPEPEPKPAVIDEIDGAAEVEPTMQLEQDEEKRGVKRRASTAFSENGGEDFKGFDFANPSDLTDYSRVLERLEAEVTAASKDFTPVRNVMATPSVLPRASKRARQDTDGSRPSSAMSSRSDEVVSSDVAASPLARGRRATTEMSSPLLRVPLERGWRRELVYRAALDAHSRRNADIYYYSPQGKKLRSTREVAEHLSGTGLTLENFSFFKEPLGVDDPEKEIIRDAKMIRRVESPVAAAPPPVEGKRAHKPKPPKGVSPEPATPKSPPAKIKVKSVGSRLSGPPTPVAKPAAKKPATPAADNNNSAAWKKPRPPHAVAVAATATATATGAATGPATGPAAATAAPVQVAASAVAVVTPPPPPLLSRPQLITSPEQRSPARQMVQPCSLTCGRGVPSLACAACLCLYHPACAGTGADAPRPFYCKNCRKSTSPASDPPPLTHKSGITSSSVATSLPAPVPRRVPGPLPVPVPVPIPVPVLKARPEKRVLLRMKAASGGPEGERVWAVAQTNAGTAKPTPRASLPQSLVRLNGRRFIVVGRALLQPHTQQAMSIDE